MQFEDEKLNRRFSWNKKKKNKKSKEKDFMKIKESYKRKKYGFDDNN